MVSNYFSHTLAWLHQISAAPYECYLLYVVVSIHEILARQLVQPIASSEGFTKAGSVSYLHLPCLKLSLSVHPSGSRRKDTFLTSK